MNAQLYELKARIAAFEASLAAMEIKHLQGKHNQKDHGRGTGGKGSGGGGKGSGGGGGKFAAGSAGARYEKNRQEVISNVSKMESALSQFEKEQKQNPRDWGYAGSLAGLASHLNDSGINVPDPPMAKTAAEQFNRRAKQVKKQLAKLKKIKPAGDNTDWANVGDVAHLAEVSRDAMTYLIDED